MGGEAGRAPSGGLRSCACSRTGWGRHHHLHRVSVLEVRKFSCHAGESFLLIFGNCLFVTPERCLGRFAQTPGLKGVTAEGRSGSSVMNRRSCSLFYQSG